MGAWMDSFCKSPLWAFAKTPRQPTHAMVGRSALHSVEWIKSQSSPSKQIKLTQSPQNSLINACLEVFAISPVCKPQSRINHLVVVVGGFMLDLSKMNVCNVGFWENLGPPCIPQTARSPVWTTPNQPWALGDCPYVYLQICRTAMPLKPPTPQNYKKRLFVGWVVSWSRHTYQFIFYYFVHP